MLEPTLISYEQGLLMQEQAVADLLDGKAGERVILLEHEPVYTIGRLRDQSSLRDPSRLPHPVVETNRGGQATYHGPGQLVGYPILDLRQRGQDLHIHLRMIEDILIASCRQWGVEAQRRDGLTGVWVADRKMASIGVGVKKWISMHGFALNVTPQSLSGFFAITPCGLDGVQMTCLSQEAQQDISVAQFAETVTQTFRQIAGVG
ncbi:MAG: lipoyl(octanoyl) transferase LipB [Verrucomicrobiota bacterium]|jgi:lipoyl(octanoyl) transferase|nr:MAG: lipoyl(octanoyl) transferase LipB [Verrucomicrobiota bacterium]